MDGTVLPLALGIGVLERRASPPSPGRWCSGTASRRRRARERRQRAATAAALRWPRRPDRIAARPRPRWRWPHARGRSRSSASIRRWSTAAWTSAPPSPAPAERAAVPHHLIDIRDPRERLQRGRLRRRRHAADRRDPRARPAAAAGGRHDAVLQGAVRRHRRDARGRPRGARRDSRPRPPRAAGRRCTPSWRGRCRHRRAAGAQRQPAHPARARGLARSGRPLSSFHAARRSRGGRRRRRCSRWSRATAPGCTQRIAERFDAMLAAGFLDEVRALRARGDLHADLPSMRCVGYRQAWEALDGDWPDARELRERGIAATRQLAKRQITWLRSMPQRARDRGRDAPGCDVRSRRSCERRWAEASHDRCCSRRAWPSATATRPCSSTSRSTSRPASSSPSSASRASASRPCSTAWPGSTAGTPARRALHGIDIGALDDERARALAPPACRLRVPGLPRAAAPGRGAERGAAADAAARGPTRRAWRAMLERGRPGRPRRAPAAAAAAAASCSAWRSRARWCTGPRCCWPTSRPATSTRRTAERVMELLAEQTREHGAAWCW